MNKFSSRFEKDLLMVYFLSSNVVMKNVWYVDSGASRHMTSTMELFSILIENLSEVQVNLGNDAKYLVVGVGTIHF